MFGVESVEGFGWRVYRFSLLRVFRVEGVLGLQGG